MYIAASDERDVSDLGLILGLSIGLGVPLIILIFLAILLLLPRLQER